MRPLAADLVAVGAGGLVAVVAVGDQQLGAGELRSTTAATSGSATRQTRLTVPSSSVTSPQGSAERAGSTSGQGSAVDSEKIGERFSVRRPRQFEAVLERAGVGALMRADGAGLVVLDPHPDQHPVAGVVGAVGRGVVLGQRPDRVLGVGREHALGAPRVDPPRRVLVGIADRPARGSAGSNGTGRSIATAL